jgi:hypothetical protein
MNVRTNLHILTGYISPLKQTDTLNETWITIGFVDKWDAEIVKFLLCYRRIVWGFRLEDISVYLWVGLLPTNITKVLIKQNKTQIDARQDKYCHVNLW